MLEFASAATFPNTFHMSIINFGVRCLVHLHSYGYHCATSQTINVRFTTQNSLNTSIRITQSLMPSLVRRTVQSYNRYARTIWAHARVFKSLAAMSSQLLCKYTLLFQVKSVRYLTQFIAHLIFNSSLFRCTFSNHIQTHIMLVNCL